MVQFLTQAAVEQGSHQHHNISQSPSFFELWNIDVILFSLLIIGAYFLIVGKWRTKFENSKPVPASKQVYFLLGMLAIILVKGTPLDYYGHYYLFSAHMLQMAVIFLVAPPLILLGLADWMFTPILKRNWSKRIFMALTFPLVSLILFNMLFSLYHVPYILDNLMGNHLLNTVYYSLMWLGAALMWWPLMDILKENKISGLWKIAYMVGNSILITPVCAIIIFSQTPLYVSFLDVPQLFKALPTLDDQQLGGVIMKVVQELTYITAVAIVFFQWSKEEKKKEKQIDEQVLAYQAQAFANNDRLQQPADPETADSTQGFSVTNPSPARSGRTT